MGNINGDFYNPAIAVAARSLTITPKRDPERFVDRLMAAKDDVNKQEVMDQLENFSCWEELERYVEHKGVDE